MMDYQTRTLVCRCIRRSARHIAESLTQEQQESIATYEREVEKARQSLFIAMRNAEDAFMHPGALR